MHRARHNKISLEFFVLSEVTGTANGGVSGNAPCGLCWPIGRWNGANGAAALGQQINSAKSRIYCLRASIFVLFPLNGLFSFVR